MSTDLATAVVGPGRWADALATLADINGQVMRRRSLPGEDSNGDEPELADIAARCRLILLAIPSARFRASARALGDHVDGSHLLVHSTRGLETETFTRLSQVLREETPTLRVGALAGPTLADEVRRGLPTAAVVGSRYPEVIGAVQEALAGERFRVYGSDDLVGVELASAFSQVVALVTGFASGLGMEFNTRATVIVRGFAEMARIGQSLGAHPATFNGLAGLGELLVSAQSEDAPHFRLGKAIGSGRSLEEAIEAMADDRTLVEAIDTLSAVRRYAHESGVRASLSDAAAALLEGRPAEEVVHQLMTLASMSETD